MIDGMRQLPLVHRKRFMNYYIAKYKRLGIDRIFNFLLNKECAAAIVHSLVAERDLLDAGGEATAPEWGDRDSMRRFCHRMAERIMQGDYVVAWTGGDTVAIKQVANDGIELHQSARELIVACIARHQPNSRWFKLLEQREFVVVNTL